MTIEINDKDFSEFLEELKTESTRNIYSYGLGIFFKWLNESKGLTIADFKTMKTKDRVHYALVFQNSKPLGEGRIYKSKRKRGMKEAQPKPLSNNAINSVLSALQSFAFHLDPDRPLPLKGKRVAIEEDTTSHDYSKEDLGKLYDFQDAKGKAIIAVASSCGLEVKSFLALDRERVEAEIRALDEKTQLDPKTPQFIFYDTVRGKTHVKGLLVLNPLAIESLKVWLPQNPTKTLFDMTTSGITKFMHNAVKKANLELKGRVRFHKIRSWTYTNLIRAGFSSEESKIIVHKSIPKSDATYLKLKEGITEKYPQVYEQFLNIRSHMNGNGLKKVNLEVEALKEALKKKDEEIESLKAQLGTSQTDTKRVLDSLQKQIDALKPKPEKQSFKYRRTTT